MYPLHLLQIDEIKFFHIIVDGSVSLYLLLFVSLFKSLLKIEKLRGWLHEVIWLGYTFFRAHADLLLHLKF